MKKEFNEMTFTEKVIDTYTGLWNFIGAVIGLLLLIFLIVILPIILIALVINWLG